MKKQCEKCKVVKPHQAFVIKNGRTENVCVECNSGKASRHKPKDEWLTLFCGEGRWMQSYDII
jgi:hypothetical protein